MKKVLKIGIAIIIVGLSALFVFGQVQAQNMVDMTVSPPKQDLNVTPGEETKIQIKFYNKTDSPISGNIRKADFLVLDKSGTPTLYDASATNNRFAASSWLTPSENKVTIAANDQYISTVTIKVPKDAYPCGHYTSIYFEPNPPTLGGQAIRVDTNSAVAFRLASLINLNVAGKCTESAFVSKFTTPKFLEYGPIDANIDVLNRSDYHITPQAMLTVKDIFNKQIDQVKLPLINIFPEAIRSYHGQIGQKWMVGPYTVTFEASYGKTGRPPLLVSSTVWVFPWRIALLIILTIVVIYVIGKALMNRMGEKTEVLEKEIREEKEELEKLREALKKRND